jgi:hypothetical protein
MFRSTINPSQNSMPRQFPHKNNADFKPAWNQKTQHILSFTKLQVKLFKPNERIRKE